MNIWAVLALTTSLLNMGMALLSRRWREALAWAAAACGWAAVIVRAQP